MKISDILTDDLVVTGLQGKTKDDIIDAMIDLVAASPKVLDKEKVRKAIFERERIMSTGVGNGFAIPHGKTDAVTDIVAALRRHRRTDRLRVTGRKARAPRLPAGRQGQPRRPAHQAPEPDLTADEQGGVPANASSSNTHPAEIIDLFRQEEATYFEV